MAVAIHQHQVIAADQGMPDDLVGRGGAIDHEEGVVGTEIARRASLGFRQGPGMVEQRTQLRHRYRQVRTQGVLAEELVERLPHRALAIGHATTVTRGVPGIVGVGGVLYQGLEEGWQQAIQVTPGGAGHLPGQEWHGVFEQVEDAAQLIEFAHGIGGGVFQGHLLAQGEDRQQRRPDPGQANQLHHVLQQVGVLPRPLGGDQHAGQAVMGGGHQPALGIVHRGKDAEAILFQLPGDAPHPVPRDRVGLDITVHDQDRELQVFIHGATSPETTGKPRQWTQGRSCTAGVSPRLGTPCNKTSHWNNNRLEPPPGPRGCDSGYRINAGCRAVESRAPGRQRIWRWLPGGPGARPVPPRWP